MTNLDSFLKSLNYTMSEGYCAQVPQQQEELRKLVSNKSVKNVLEIGFNGGHSSELFLDTNKDVKVVSFDINRHKAVDLGKFFIDEVYPERHTLILGNSLTTVPDYAKNNTTKFDLIFIDGGHEYVFSKGDLHNCKALAHEKTVVIMDDTQWTPQLRAGWNDGPNKSWLEARDSGLIKQIACVDFNVPGRGMSWGNYLF